MHQVFNVALKALIEQDNKFLVLKKTTNDQNNPLSGWETPRGHIEAGESLEEGLNREIVEETGLQISESARQLFNAFLSDPKSKQPVLGLNYIIHIKKGEVTLDYKEHSEHRWLTVAEIRKLTESIGLQKELDAYLKYITNK